MTYRIAGFVGALLLSVSVASAALEAKPGWATSEEYDKALAFAKKSGKPVTVLFALKETGCPLHNGSFDAMVNDKSLASTVKVVLWIDATTSDKASLEKFKEFNKSVKPEEVYAPQLFLLDSEGRISAEVGYGKEAKIKAEAAKVAELTAWQAASVKQIAKADKDAAAGKFAAALSAIEKIDARDRAVSAAITAALMGQPALAAEAPKAKRSTKSAADESAAATSAPEMPAGRYFPELLTSKREACEKLASDRLAEARAKIETKDVAGARKLLSAMVADGSTLAAVAEAKTLLEGLQVAAK